MSGELFSDQEFIKRKTFSMELNLFFFKKESSIDNFGLK